MNRTITTDSLALILAKSRLQCDKSQKAMAKALGKSLGTIQNWESGLSIPNLIDMLDWFNVLGLNPLRYVLNFIHAETFGDLQVNKSDEEIDKALDKYITSIATMSDKRKLAFSIFGSTGSSWSSQLDMICALNHLPIIDRVSIAESIYNLYEMKESLDMLRSTEHIKPDMLKLRSAIDNCKRSVMEGKNEYSNN